MPRDVLVSCLGANARYLPHMTVPCPVFALCDSMGAAIPLGLGMALERPDRHVIALEGDGSLLMSPNVLATVAAAAPPMKPAPESWSCEGVKLVNNEVQWIKSVETWITYGRELLSIRISASPSRVWATTAGRGGRTGGKIDDMR